MKPYLNKKQKRINTYNNKYKTTKTNSANKTINKYIFGKKINNNKY